MLDVPFVESVFKESRRYHVTRGPQNGRNAIADEPDVFWSRGGEASPNANMAMGGGFAEPRAGVARVRAIMGDLPFLWFAPQGDAFASLRAALREAGFAQEDEERLMVLDLDEARPPPPTDLAFRAVADERDARRYHRVWREAFGVPERGAQAWLDHHLPMLAPGSPLRHFVGERDGEAVACGTAFLASRAVGAFSIAVLPDARRRGFGAAMTWRVVEEGAREGRRRAILGASRDGRSVYARLGFRDVGGHDVFVMR